MRCNKIAKIKIIANIVQSGMEMVKVIFSLKIRYTSLSESNTISRMDGTTWRVFFHHLHIFSTKRKTSHFNIVLTCLKCLKPSSHENHFITSPQ